MASPNRLKLSAAAAVAVLGGAAAIALTAAPDPATDPAATPIKRPPPEVRTKVIRRTVHRVKREQPAPSGAMPPVPTTSAAAAAAPAVTPAPAPTQPVAAPAPPEPASDPVTTRSSGSAGEREGDDRSEADGHDDGSFEAEHEDD
jgi:hypothetical protein